VVIKRYMCAGVLPMYIGTGVVHACTCAEVGQGYTCAGEVQGYTGPEIRVHRCAWESGIVQA
jgi:hypothetical protein